MHFKIRVSAQGHCDIVDLTPQARALLEGTEVREGIATFFVCGSTAGLTTLEFEPGLIRDVKEFFERILPEARGYHHDKTWGDGNGFSHLRAALLKPSLTVPIVAGALALGTWQQVVLIDFDNRPRTREVVFQIQAA